MTIIELKEQIVKKELSNFYIFTGEEIGIINIYLNQMSKVLGMPVVRAESVESIYGNCMGGSLFGDSAAFYVIRDDKDFMKAEKSYPTISADIGKNVIVLLYDKIDSRLKFGKFFKDCTVNFEKLAPNVLKTYIKKEIQLSDANINTLIDVCSGSYDMCMLEVDKVKQFQKSLDSKHSSDDCFEHLLDAGAIYQPQETDVFKFTEAVCSHNVKRAIELETVLRENGNSSINILGTLYNSMRAVLLIQCCEGNNIAEVTGLDKGQIYFNKKYAGVYSVSTLVYAVKLISKVIEGVKNGKIDDRYATEYVLVHIL